MLQENNIINISTTATTTSAASASSASSALALCSLSSQSSSAPSSPSSYTQEYDTSNYFSRLPDETVFTILVFAVTRQNTVTTTPSTTVYSPHKQLSIISQVCRLFYKIANDVLLWQITFETTFDSEAIIRAGIIDNSVIEGDSVSVFGGAKGESEGTTQNPSSSVKMQTGRNIWRELYKERQIALNKIKNYIKPTLPSPFVFGNDDDVETDDFSTTVHLDDFMEFHFDEENENDNENDITNIGDNSALDSTVQVDDNVDYQLFDFDIDFNFIGNEKDEARTEEMERDRLAFTFDGEFRFQELDNNTLEDSNVTFTTGDTIKEDTIKEDTIKEDAAKEDNVKEDNIKEDAEKVDVLKEDIERKESLKENITEFNLEDNFGMDNTSVINVDDVSQGLDFVSEDLIKFDDPELDSIFASDSIKLDNFVDIQDSNVVENIENDTKSNEVIVKDTNNSAEEVDHIIQAQDFSNPEINGDLNIAYLQDYDESSKLLDYDEESFKLPDDEDSSSKLQNFDEGIPQLQDCGESLTKFQKLLEISSSKLSYDGNSESVNDDLPDYDENEEVSEVSQLQDYNYNQDITNLQAYNENEELSQIKCDFDRNKESVNLLDFNDIKVENSSREIINEHEIDLPAYEEDEDNEMTNLPNYEMKTNPRNENTVIENDNYDLPDYADEEVNLFNEDTISIINEDNNEQENGLPNGEVIIEKENDDLLDYDEVNDVESSQPSYDENEDGMTRQNHENGLEEMDDIFNNFVSGREALDLFLHDNIQSQSRIRVRRKIIRQNNDPELLNTLDIIWKICQENDGMNSEVLLGASVKEFIVNLIQSLDKMGTQIECLSIALQILSILTSWHPELTIDLHKNSIFWSSIHYAITYVDMFFPESVDSIGYKQLVLPASAGSAIHILFHTSFFNLPNPGEFFDAPPQLIPDSNIFNNIYNKSELKLEETVIQPFGEDLSGKWCGYYLDYQPSPLREPAMDIRSLKFSPSESGKVYYLNCIDNDNPVRVTDKVIKEFSGSGSDKYGEFVIRRGIITEKGNVNFIKTYQEHSRIYDGILLPVGICGRWGTSSKWHGNFWIWKR